MSYLQGPLEAYGIDSRVERAVVAELKYQDDKWGKDKEQSFPGFLLILENELAEAKLGWAKGGEERQSALHEVTQIAAVALRCINTYGTIGCPRSTFDSLPTDD